MPALPPFPTHSLYGNFPSFPTYTFAPQLWGTTLFSITLPNITQIPQFIMNVVLYYIEWGAAIFEWLFQYAGIGAENLTLWLVSTSTSDFNSLVLTSNRAAAATGIFAPVILTALIMLIVLSAITITFLLINAIKMVIP